MFGLRESRAELRESCVTSREPSIYSRQLSLTPRNQRVHSGKLRADGGDQRLGFHHLCVHIKDSTLSLGDERTTLKDLCLTPGDESVSVGNQSVGPGAPALESGAPWDGLYEWAVVVGGCRSKIILEAHQMANKVSESVQLGFRKTLSCAARRLLPTRVHDDLKDLARGNAAS